MRQALNSIKEMFREPGPVNPLEPLVTSIREELSIKAAPKANIINLSLKWADPRWAQRFLDGLMEVYQQRRSDLYAPPGAEQFFQRQTEQAAQGVQLARQALSSYLAETGITMIDAPQGADILAAEKSTALENRRRLENQYTENETETRALQSEVDTLGSQILAEAQHVAVDLRDRQGAKLHQDLLLAQREERELEEQRLGQQDTLEKVRTRLTTIRALEDRLRSLLVTGNVKPGPAPSSSAQVGLEKGPKATSANTIKNEVERLYKELAELGQLKRYDLNTGQDTSVPEGLERALLDTEVAIRRVQERRRTIENQLAGIATEALDAPPTDAPESADANSADLDEGGQDMVSEAIPEGVARVIAHTQEKLAQTGALLGVLDQRQLAPIFLDLVARLVAAQAELNKASARGQALREQRAVANNQLVLLNEQATHVRELRRDLAREEDAFERYREKSDIAGISSAMVKEQLVNTSIAQPATVATDPVGPSKKLTLALALAFASLGGTGLALILEHLDLSLSTGDQVEERLGLIHLVSVPEGHIEGPLVISLTLPRSRAEISDAQALPSLAAAAPLPSLNYPDRAA